MALCFSYSIMYEVLAVPYAISLFFKWVFPCIVKCIFYKRRMKEKGELNNNTNRISTMSCI